MEGVGIEVRRDVRRYIPFEHGQVQRCTQRSCSRGDVGPKVHGVGMAA